VQEEKEEFTENMLEKIEKKLGIPLFSILYSLSNSINVNKLDAVMSQHEVTIGEA
jgi:hypothetical protein